MSPALHDGIRYAVRPVASRVEWNDFVAAFPAAGLGFHWGMGQLLVRYYGFNSFQALGVYESVTDSLVGVAPCAASKSRVFSMGEGIRGGVLVKAPHDLEQCVRAILEHLASQGYSCLQVVCPASTQSAAGGTLGFCHSTSVPLFIVRGSFVADLSGHESNVMQLYDGKARNQVRKALKNGLLVRAVDPFEYEADIKEMLADTEARQKAGRPWVRTKHLAQTRARFRDFMGAWKDSFGEDFHAMAAFETTGRPVAFLAFVRAYRFVSLGTFVSRTDSLPLCPNNLLIHTMFEWAASHGVRWIDLAASGYSGLAGFKSSFGASPLTTAYFHVPFSARGRIEAYRLLATHKCLQTYYYLTNALTSLLRTRR